MSAFGNFLFSPDDNFVVLFQHIVAEQFFRFRFNDLPDLLIQDFSYVLSAFQQPRLILPPIHKLRIIGFLFVVANQQTLMIIKFWPTATCTVKICV